MTLLTLSHAELGEALNSLKLGVTASDLHGSLIGYLCANGQADPNDWLSTLEFDLQASKPTLAHQEVLKRLYRYCRTQLDDPELKFEPLLPEGAATIFERADGLVEWCRGFLGGVGLAGAATAALSVDATEILRDFGNIAASHFEYANTEEDENALMEIVEFVRVSVLLLYGELGTPPALFNATLH